MTELKFLVQGSETDPYQVIFRRGGSNLTVTCTCSAGAMGQHCKHRLNLMLGDVTALVGGDDPSGISAIVADTDVAMALENLTRAEAAAEAAKKEVTNRKKALARTMGD